MDESLLLPAPTAAGAVHWRALTAECTVAADQVLAGSLALRRLDPTLIGSFYAAFFPLSIGYERMSKIAIQVDALISTGQFLSSGEMRSTSAGHRISTLFDRVETIAVQRGYDSEMGLRPATPMHHAITGILTEFATTGRYNHLDSLSSTSPSSLDAEKAWDETVMPLLVDAHLTKRARMLLDRDVAAVTTDLTAAESAGITVLGRRHDANGDFHGDLARHAARNILYERLTPWGRMYTLQLGRWIAWILYELSMEALRCDHARGHVPYLIDFFRWMLAEDADLRSRRDLTR